MGRHSRGVRRLGGRSAGAAWRSQPRGCRPGTVRQWCTAISCRRCRPGNVTPRSIHAWSGQPLTPGRREPCPGPAGSIPLATADDPVALRARRCVPVQPHAGAQHVNEVAGLAERQAPCFGLAQPRQAGLLPSPDGITGAVRAGPIEHAETGQMFGDTADPAPASHGTPCGPGLRSGSRTRPPSGTGSGRTGHQATHRHGLGVTVYPLVEQSTWNNVTFLGGDASKPRAPRHGYRQGRHAGATSRFPGAR